MTTSDYLIVFMKILGSLALLIYGMKVMSEALQKMAGSQLRHILGAMTTNRFTGMLTGTFITCAVQSSSATTVMTVSFVNAGLLTLVQAFRSLWVPISVQLSRHGLCLWGSMSTLRWLSSLLSSLESSSFTVRNAVMWVISSLVLPSFSLPLCY